MPWNETEEKQFNITKPIADALDKKPPSVFTPFDETRWHKGVLTRLQVGDTEQTWLHVTNLAGKTFDVTKDMADTLPSADDWKELKRMHYRQNWESLDDGTEANEDDAANGDDELDQGKGGGGTWFALQIAIPSHESTREYHKQVWAGDHKGAPFVKPDESKATKPDADDWAREFGRYPRKTLPDWAQPIVASASKDARATAPLSFVHPFMTNWSCLLTAAHEVDLWAYITRRKWLNEVEKHLGTEWTCEESYDQRQYYFHAEDDDSKGFIARAHEVLLLDDNDAFMWSWAAERGEHDGPSRAILDYGYAHDMADLTRAYARLRYGNRYDVVRCATVLGAALSDFPLSYIPETGTPVLLDVLAKDAAKNLVGEVSPSYVDIPVVAPTYEDVVQGINALFSGEQRSRAFRMDHDHLRQQLHYLSKRTGSKCEDDGDKTTFSPPTPPVDENGYRSYDPDRESNQPKLVFTFTKESISFTTGSDW